MDLSRSSQLLNRTWRVLSPLPGGERLFSKLVGTLSPYTGSIGARIREMSPGHAVASVRERHGLRNHVKSVHAIALINLAELTSGLAVMAGLAGNVRGLPVELRIRYHKKARGVITARCDCQPPRDVGRRQEFEAQAELRDPSGTLVADATAIWVIEPV